MDARLNVGGLNVGAGLNVGRLKVGAGLTVSSCAVPGPASSFVFIPFFKGCIADGHVHCIMTMCSFIQTIKQKNKTKILKNHLELCNHSIFTQNTNYV